MKPLSLERKEFLSREMIKFIDLLYKDEINPLLLKYEHHTDDVKRNIKLLQATEMFMTMINNLEVNIMNMLYVASTMGNQRLEMGDDILNTIPPLKLKELYFALQLFDKELSIRDILSISTESFEILMDAYESKDIEKFVSIPYTENTKRMCVFAMYRLMNTSLMECLQDLYLNVESKNKSKEYLSAIYNMYPCYAAWLTNENVKKDLEYLANNNEMCLEAVYLTMDAITEKLRNADCTTRKFPRFMEDEVMQSKNKYHALYMFFGKYESMSNAEFEDKLRKEYEIKLGILRLYINAVREEEQVRNDNTRASTESENATSYVIEADEEIYNSGKNDPVIKQSVSPKHQLNVSVYLNELCNNNPGKYAMALNNIYLFLTGKGIEVSKTFQRYNDVLIECSENDFKYILHDSTVSVEDVSTNPVINWLGEKNSMSHFFYTLYPDPISYIGRKQNRLLYKLNGEDVKLSEARKTQYREDWGKIIKICAKIDDAKK